MMKPINHNLLRNPRNKMIQDFLPRFTYMPASQSSLWQFTHLEFHVLIGITHQTLNRVPHNQHKMRIIQATSNPLEYLLALRRQKVKNPSQSPRSEPETITNLRSMILAAPSIQVAATTKSNKRIPQQNTNTKCLQIETLKQCTWIHSQSHKDDESMMEISGSALVKLTRLLYQCKWPRV